MKKHQSIKVIALGGFIALAAACSHSPDPAKVAADIAKAQSEGQKKVIDARADLQKVMAANQKTIADAQTDQNEAAAKDSSKPPSNDVNTAAIAGNKKLADAQYDVDQAVAESAYNVAVATCGSQMGDALKNCKESAKSKYDGELSMAKSKRDSVKS